MRLQGRAALVTGGASGVGAAIVRLFAAEGAHVLVLDRDAERGERLAAATAPLGAVEFVAGDVTREEDVAGAVRACVERFGRLDVMCNNAGMQLIAPLHETTNEQWEAVNAVNVRATFWGCKHAIVAMRERGGGTIVNTASISSFMGDPLLPAYTATKAAVAGLTRAVGVAYAADGIRCNCVCPGDTDTPMIQEYFDAQRDPARARAAVAASYPAGRIADPGEVAEAVLFLASQASSFINATSLVVDAGLTVSPY